MKPLFLAFLFLFQVHFLYGQDEEKYYQLVEDAYKLYENKDFLASAQKYSEAFIALDNKGYPNDRYNAACSWALASVVDSAFFQLEKICKIDEHGYNNLGHITKDSDLDILHSDPRWTQIISNVKANKDKLEENYDKPLKALLDSIQEEDQNGRRKINAIASEFGYESTQMKDLWKEIGLKDSLNLILVENILQTKGWLGPDIIGYSGSSTLFLVIQHSNQATQEKYLPMMREAAKKGDASRSSLALLEDRILLGQGKRQTYGSQIGRDPETNEHFVLPLEDPGNVDQRRETMDLGPLAEYTQYFEFAWDLEKHKKDTESYEKKNKKDIKKKRKAAKKRGVI